VDVGILYLNVNTSKQNIMESKPNFEKQTGKKNTDYKTKKRQWQSVKDKRKRNKKIENFLFFC
jgi:hypothetical protein